MVKLKNPFKVIYKDKEYAVYKLMYNTTITYPVIIDWNKHDDVESLEKSWHINDTGNVICAHRLDNKIYEFNLHDLILRLNDIEKKQSVIHINKLGIDCRLNNLIYNDTIIKRNMKKKERTLQIEDLDMNKIPSYIWYMKADKTHGDRFVVNIDDINWKSTSKNNLSIHYKLEQTKKYLRFLKQSYPQLFSIYSMNGDLNETGKQRLDEFFKIAFSAGFTHLNEISLNNTKKYLQEDLSHLSHDEIQLLNEFTPTI